MVGALLVTPEQRRSINPQGSNPHNSHNIYLQTPQKPSREDLLIRKVNFDQDPGSLYMPQSSD